MKYFVKNNQVGLLFKKQKLTKILSAGNYRIFSNAKNMVIIHQKDALEKYGIEVKTLNNNKILLSKITSVTLQEHEVAIHFVDGLYYELLTSGSYSFFKDSYKHSFMILDTREIYLPDSVDLSILKNRNFLEANSRLGIIQTYIIEEGTVGILKVNGKFEKLLQPGKHHFFVNINSLNVKVINLRNQVLQISGQELLTRDKVTLRMNFVLTYKIIDSIKVANEFEQYQEQLYLLMQLALREYVSTKTLDELLAEKHEIGKIILETVKEKEADFGTHFSEAGVKDIILPGEIKDILNTTLIAEKKALANVITRREETASTRSLLNTAKLMDENTTLYKLKELEYLERICDKVGNISISSSSGIIEQLNQIIKGKQ